jgi:hypothetical protein
MEAGRDVLARFHAAPENSGDRTLSLPARKFVEHTGAETGQDQAATVKPAQADLINVSSSLSILYFDARPEDLPARGRAPLAVEVDGVPQKGRLLSSRLELKNASSRTVVLVEHPAADLKTVSARLVQGKTILAVLDSERLMPSAQTFKTLVSDLTPKSLQRLLQLVFTTGASFFGSGSDPDYPRWALALLDLTTPTLLKAVSVCAVGKDGLFASYRLSNEFGGGRSFIFCSSEALRKTRTVTSLEEEDGAGTALHVFLKSAPSEGAELLCLDGASPLRLSLDFSESKLRAFGPWHDQRSDAAKTWAETVLDALPASDNGAEKFLAEIDAPLPEAELTFAQPSPSGVLLALRLKDPANLVRSIRVVRGQEEQLVDLDALPAFPRCDGALAFFTPLKGRRDTPVATLQLVCGTGRLINLHVTDGLEDPSALEQASGAEEALARFKLAARAPRFTCREIVSDTQPQRVGLSLIIAASSFTDTIRARLAMLGLERGRRQVELIYHLNEGRSSEQICETIATAHRVFRLPYRIAVLSAAAREADRVKAALNLARGDRALFMGEGIVPDAPGWLAPWLKSPGRSNQPWVAGGLVASANGSVLEAGTCLNAKSADLIPRFDRQPLSILPDNASRATDTVSSDFFAMNKPAVETFLDRPALHETTDVCLADLIGSFDGDVPSPRVMLRRRAVNFLADQTGRTIEQRAVSKASALVLTGAIDD